MTRGIDKVIRRSKYDLMKYQPVGISDRFEKREKSSWEIVVPLVDDLYYVLHDDVNRLKSY